jgi:hypothetical protein
MQSRCQGRKTTPKSTPLFFETGPRLHRSKPLSYLGIVPCTNEAEDLCAACLDRQKATAYQLEKRAGKYIPNQETMFHGRMDEPIPKWSRLEGGEWFQAQLAAGYTVGNAHKEIATSPVGMSDVAAPVIKKVVRRKKVITGSTETPKPEPVPATKKREPKKVGVVPEPISPPPVTMLHTTSGFVGREEAKAKKTKKGVAVTQEITEVVPIPIGEVKAAPKPKRVFKPKKAVIGIVEVSADDIPVTKIQVKREEIGGRSVYVSETKDKVYDMSYSYLGRWNRKEGRVDTSFPDSDAEPL